MAKKVFLYRYFLKDPKDSICSDSVVSGIDSAGAKIAVMPRRTDRVVQKNDSITLFAASKDSVLLNHQELRLICSKGNPGEHKRYEGQELPVGLNESLAIQVALLLCVGMTIYSFSVGRSFYDYCIRFFNFKERIRLNSGKRNFEFEAKAALFIQSLLLKGILFYNLMRVISNDAFLKNHFNIGVVLFVGIFAAYYLIKLFIVYVLGSMFSSKRDLNAFLSDYFSLLSVEGLLLLFPTIAMIVIVVAILLIMSGVKIFFKNYRGFFYILLYLCALEVYPAIVLYQVLSYCYQNF
jgi:hypothetical protein